MSLDVIARRPATRAAVVLALAIAAAAPRAAIADDDGGDLVSSGPASRPTPAPAGSAATPAR